MSKDKAKADNTTLIEAFEAGVKAGVKSVYLGSYGHNDGLEMMTRKVKNPLVTARCPECKQRGWDGVNHHDRNSTSCTTCGWRKP